MTAQVLDDPNTIVKSIVEQTTLTEEQVKESITKKQEQYAGLLTESGAAVAVAKENNVNLGSSNTETQPQQTTEEKQPEILRLEEMTDNLRDISFECRVARIYPIRKFNSKGREGQLASLEVTDGTTSRRFVLWNEMAELSKDLSFNQPIKVQGARTKLNNNQIEIHTAWKTTIDKIQNTEIPDLFQSFIKVADLKSGDREKYIEATVTNVYNPTFIKICPNCRAMVRQGICDNCGEKDEKEVQHSLIVNAELDDDSGVIRATFYRSVGEQLLDATAKQLIENQDLFETKKKNIIGQKKVFFGETKDVPEFSRMDFIVRSIA